MHMADGALGKIIINAINALKSIPRAIKSVAIRTQVSSMRNFYYCVALFFCSVRMDYIYIYTIADQFFKRAAARSRL